MKKYTVYKITNTINGKIYIGVHVTNNLDDGYMGSGKILKIAQDKYGIENFEKEYLHIFDSPDEMFEMESTLVNELFIQSNDTYNIREGGNGSWGYINDSGSNNKVNQYLWLKNKLETDDEYRKKHSEKISKAVLNSGFDFSEHSSNKKHTKESKRKIGEANSKYQSGKGNSQYGKIWIYNEELKESKRIDKSSEIPNGWERGRKIKW